jgi:hypothetical protein
MVPVKAPGAEQGEESVSPKPADFGVANIVRAHLRQERLVELMKCGQRRGVGSEQPLDFPTTAMHNFLSGFVVFSHILDIPASRYLHRQTRVIRVAE